MASADLSSTQSASVRISPSLQSSIDEQSAAFTVKDTGDNIVTVSNNTVSNDA